MSRPIRYQPEEWSKFLTGTCLAPGTCLRQLGVCGSLRTIYTQDHEARVDAIASASPRSAARGRVFCVYLITFD